MKDTTYREDAINALKWEWVGKVVIDAIKDLPSAQQKPLKYTGDSICLYCQTVNCDGCIYEPMEVVQ